jgi:hypothetical protein
MTPTIIKEEMYTQGRALPNALSSSFLIVLFCYLGFVLCKTSPPTTPHLKITESVGLREVKKTLVKKYSLGTLENPWEVIVCGHARGDAHILREWVLWNLAAGIQHFVIFNNNDASQGGISDAFNEALKPFPASLVTTHRYPKDVMNNPSLAKLHGIPQSDIDALNMNLGNVLKTRCYELYNRRAKWIAFIDDDEVFVPLKENLLLPEFLSSPQFNYDHIGGVGFFWRVASYSGKFSGGEHKFEDYNVCPRSFYINRWIKTIAKTLVNGKPTVEHLESAHFLVYKSNFSCVPETGNNERGCSPSDTEDTKWTTFAGSSNFQLNHYYSRSVEDWIRKVLRGSHFQLGADYIYPSERFAMYSACASVDDGPTILAAKRVSVLRREMRIPFGPLPGPLPPISPDIRIAQPVLAIFYDALSLNKTWDSAFYSEANAARPECVPMPPMDTLLHFWAKGGYESNCFFRFV